MPSFIIGISGVTNGGKTTITEKIKNSFQNVTTMNMDDYYWEENSEHHIPLKEFNDYANWEVLTSVDFGSMVNDVKKWSKERHGDETKRLLIIEGILIFNHRELAELFNCKFFITLDKEECWRRRRLRTYLPPEPDGYFDAICWPEYIKNKQEIANQKDIVYLDGNEELSQLYATVINHIEQIS